MNSNKISEKQWYDKYEPESTMILVFDENGKITEFRTIRTFNGHLNSNSLLRNIHKKIIIIDSSNDIRETPMQIVGSPWTGIHEFHSGKIGKTCAVWLKELMMLILQAKPCETPKLIEYFCKLVEFTKMCKRKFPKQFIDIKLAAESSEQECILQATLVLSIFFPESMNSDVFLQKLYLALHRMYKRYNKTKEHNRQAGNNTEPFTLTENIVGIMVILTMCKYIETNDIREAINTIFTQHFIFFGSVQSFDKSLRNEKIIEYCVGIIDSSKTIDPKKIAEACFKSKVTMPINPEPLKDPPYYLVKSHSMVAAGIDEDPLATQGTLSKINGWGALIIQCNSDKSTSITVSGRPINNQQSAGGSNVRIGSGHGIKSAKPNNQRLGDGTVSLRGIKSVFNNSNRLMVYHNESEVPASSIIDYHKLGAIELCIIEINPIGEDKYFIEVFVNGRLYITTTVVSYGETLIAFKCIQDISISLEETQLNEGKEEEEDMPEYVSASNAIPLGGLSVASMASLASLFVSGNGQNIINNPPNNSEPIELNEYLCPILQVVMTDPVLASDGNTYEKIAIEQWFNTQVSSRKKSPLTNEYLEHNNLTPNITLKKLIDDYKQSLITYTNQISSNTMRIGGSGSSTTTTTPTTTTTTSNTEDANADGLAAWASEQGLFRNQTNINSSRATAIERSTRSTRSTQSTRSTRSTNDEETGLSGWATAMGMGLYR